MRNNCIGQLAVGFFVLALTPSARGAVTQLSGTLTSGGNVGSYFIISADSTRVVYRGDQDTDNELELYSVTLPAGSKATLYVIK